MSAPLPTPPDGNYLAWVTQHPEEVAEYLERVAALSRLELVITVNGVSKKAAVKFSPTNATLELNLGTV